MRLAGRDKNEGGEPEEKGGVSRLPSSGLRTTIFAVPVLRAANHGGVSDGNNSFSKTPLPRHSAHFIQYEVASLDPWLLFNEARALGNSLPSRGCNSSHNCQVLIRLESCEGLGAKAGVRNPFRTRLSFSSPKMARNIQLPGVTRCLLLQLGHRIGLPWHLPRFIQ